MSMTLLDDLRFGTGAGERRPGPRRTSDAQRRRLRETGLLLGCTSPRDLVLTR